MNKKTQEIIENFQLMESPEDKYAYLIDIGKTLPPFEESKKNNKYLVEGCTSKLWADIYEKNGKLIIEATSNALIVNGLLAILKALYEGTTKEDRQKIDLDQTIELIGLKNLISKNRKDGLYSVANLIKNV
jgi:cysteine desulfuration protein SufE